MRMSKPKLRSAPTAAPKRMAGSLSDQRQAGAALQARRLKLWTACPYCAHCGRFTVYPGGFELDHIQALENGGADTEENLQVLCVVWQDGRKEGCHVTKTRQDLGYKAK